MVLLAATLLVTACGADRGAGPAGTTDRAAQEQRRIAALSDSLRLAGDAPGAARMQALAELVRLSGRLSPIDVRVDGTVQRFDAVGVQIELDPAACGSECGVYLPAPAQLLIGWQVEAPARVFVFVTNSLGRTDFTPLALLGRSGSDSWDDVAGGLPGAGGGEPLPLALGAFVEQAREQLWVTVAGALTTAAADPARGTCPVSQLVSQGVQYTCARADFRFAVDATLLPLSEAGIDPAGVRRLSASSQPVPGVAFAISGLGRAQLGRNVLGPLVAAPLRARPGT
jgi:hypothetical protein